MIGRARPADVWLVWCGEKESEREGFHEWRRLSETSEPVSALVPPERYRAALAMASHEALRVRCPFCGIELNMN
jgi:hypothetical protein